MINLLPHQYKQEIGYARRNLHLRNWIVASAIALLGVLLIVAGGLFYLQTQINASKKQIEIAQQQLASQDLEGTQKRVKEISDNTKLATQVLSREVLFSKLIKQIGTTLPPNTALQSLKIDNAQNGVELNAGASDFTAGTQLQINLQDPKNGVFEKADINNITCGGNGSQTNGRQSIFPCQIDLRALFSKNNSYLFIAPSAEGGNR